MLSDDAIIAVLARGPMTARQLAAALDLDPGAWRDVLDPIAQLSRARLARLGPPNPPARRDGPGTTLRYQLTRAGELSAADAPVHFRAADGPPSEHVMIPPTTDPEALF